MRTVLKPAALIAFTYSAVGKEFPQAVGLPGTSIVFPMFMPIPIFETSSEDLGRAKAEPAKDAASVREIQSFMRKPHQKSGTL